MCAHTAPRTRRVRRHPQHLEPVPLAQDPERYLRRAVWGLEQLGLRHGLEMPFVGLVGDVILGERFIGELHGEVFSVEPDGGVVACQARFAVEAPVAEADKARSIHASAEAGRVEDAMQLLRWAGTAVDPSEHRRRAAGRVGRVGQRAGRDLSSRIWSTLMATSSQPQPAHHVPFLVGREREQATLRQALDDMLTGHGSLVLVSGEAGIGKTTLVDWLADEATDQGGLVLRGGCYDLTATPPYGPWAEALASYSPQDSLPPLPPFVNDLAAFSALGSQERLFATTREFLFEVATGQPLLICLEDLHWADRASLDFLRVMGRGTANHRITIVATYRSDELNRQHLLYPVLPILIRESRAERIELRPLDDDATRKLIRHTHVLSESDERRLETYLREHAEGNAFYSLELLRSLEDAGVLARVSEAWTLGDLTNVRLPMLLQQVIESRLARLGDETRSLLQVAAIIGQDLSVDLWQRVSDADDDALAVAIEQGKAAQILTEAGPDGHYRFRHALVREALYREVLLIRRRGWHRRVAEALLDLQDPDPDLVAYHFHQAGEMRATQWLIRAGERAQWTYALLSAADRFEEAVRQMEAHDSDVGERGWLLLRVGWLRRMSQPRLAITSIEKALRLSHLADDLTLSAYATFSLGLFRRVGGEPHKGLATLEEGVAAVDRLSSGERVRLCERLASWGLDETDPRGTLAVNLCSAGRYKEARHLADAVVSGISPLLRSPKVGGSGYADAFSAVAIVHAALGEPDDASKAFSRADHIFHAIGDDFQSGLNAASMLFTVVLPYHADQIAERSRLASLADEALRRTSGVRDEDPRIAYLPLLELEGKWRELRQLVAAYDAGWDNVGWIVAPIAREQGDTDLAWKLVRQLMPEGPSTEPGSIGYVAALSYQRLATALSLDVGDLQSAQTWLDSHDRWLDWSGTVLGRGHRDNLAGQTITGQRAIIAAHSSMQTVRWVTRPSRASRWRSCLPTASLVS